MIQSIQAIALCFDQIFDEILLNTKFETVKLNDSQHFEIVKHFISLLLNISKLRGNMTC